VPQPTAPPQLIEAVMLEMITACALADSCRCISEIMYLS
jgi:hypothetical protein